MHASIPQPRGRLPAWLSVVVWLATFFSPTVYFLLLVLAIRFHIQGPPQSVVWLLFLFIPVVALLVCESTLWMHSKTVARKIPLMFFTLLGMLLQVGFLVAIIRAILIAATAYVQ